jgi:hypothetical protein
VVHWHRQGKPCIAREATIAADLGLGLRSVERALAMLKGMSWVDVVARNRSGKRHGARTNVVRLTPEGKMRCGV